MDELTDGVLDNHDERELEGEAVFEGGLELEMIKIGLLEPLTTELEELVLDEYERLELGISRVELAVVLDIDVEEAGVLGLDVLIAVLLALVEEILDEVELLEETRGVEP
ncbi:uncharacterized protein N7477_001674 [Penicillium maclennaniae]|uniref:uncharacterized protein n=1 Tax=Penicillium maclennaniae TaxID=1343394 RepID=UPI00253F896C|nr:uncharacterized protein N7477_001674 [Penicillium maclennaniae]KAJ5681734.1 hypothetical protein N7477_001674 [Penicillium maclennaniae]